MSLQKNVQDQSTETVEVDPLKFATKHSSEKFEFPTSDEHTVEDTLDDKPNANAPSSE